MARISVQQRQSFEIVPLKRCGIGSTVGKEMVKAATESGGFRRRNSEGVYSTLLAASSVMHASTRPRRSSDVFYQAAAAAAAPHSIDAWADLEGMTSAMGCGVVQTWQGCNTASTSISAHRRRSSNSIQETAQQLPVGGRRGGDRRRRSSASIHDRPCDRPRRRSSSSIQEQHRRASYNSNNSNRRRRSGCLGGNANGGGGSFAVYSRDSMNSTQLAIQELQQYFLDDLSYDEDDDDRYDAQFDQAAFNDEDETVSLDLCSEEDDEFEMFEENSLEEEEDEDDDDNESVDLEQATAAEPTPCFQPRHTSWNTPLSSSISNFDASSTWDSLTRKKKQLSFGTVTVREYAVTVGALSAAKDECPLQLSWEYGADVQHAILRDDPLISSTPLRRLTMHERKKRIATVQGISEGLVDCLQLEMVLHQVQEEVGAMSWYRM